MKNTILGMFILAVLATAQVHNVVLTWNDNICVGPLTGTCNPPGVTYNLYKSPGPCPAAGALPNTDPIPFSTIVNVAAATTTGPIMLSYTDVGAISPGQAFCYYATVVNGYTINTVTGLVILNESPPSNYAYAALQIAGAPPLAPTNTKAMLQ